MSFGVGGGVTLHSQLLDVSTPHAASEIPPVWEKVAEETLSSNATDIEFTGLDINTDECYRLFVNFANATGTLYLGYLYVNGDTTDTNYYSDIVQVNATIVSSNRYNDSRTFQLNANERGIVNITIWRDVDGYPRWRSNTNYATGSNVQLQDFSVCKTGTVANITSLTVHAGGANAFKSGTKAILYKVSR